MSEFEIKRDDGMRKVRTYNVHDFISLLEDWLERHKSTDEWVDDIEAILLISDYKELLDELSNLERQYNVKIELKAIFKGGRGFANEIIIKGFRITYS